MTDQPCILIVESDVLIRHPLAEYLRECGYRVIEAVNDAEARELLGAGELSVEIVLADAQAETGFALAGWIRDHHPAIQIMLAGTVAKAAERAGELCQDGTALTRPHEHHAVLDRIRRLLGARGRGPQRG